ncbi:MAG TPA: TonB-dependent receptor [Candidatus Acidoferrales bacterium]|nr:TonB-dependent receptor [Candidatus Acidoferrales bacterium]
MKRISAQLLVTAVLCLGCCAGVFAQATSQISGTVTDASGAVIAGAQITATQIDTGIARTATSDTSGVYTLPSLPLGPYRVEVKREGFTTFVQTGVILQVGTAVTVNPVLKVGAVSQSVQVEATAPMIDTTTTGVGQVVNSQSVVDLPLNGRQVTQLITLAGASNTVQYGFGGAPSVGNLVSSKNYPNEDLVSVAGGILNGTTYLMDGGTFNDPFNNLNLPTPFPDAVQEFNVQTSAIPAQYGEHTGGAINIATKSGTNAFHGDAFEFVRNSDFNAKDFFSVSAAHPDGLSDGLKRNQFGGTIGGPIKKDKVFFFLGYQGTLIRQQPPANQAILPTASELAGNFQNYISQCFQGRTPPTLNSAYYTGNQLNYAVPADVMAFASHFPVGPEPCGVTTFQLIANQNEHMGVGRVDYQINSKQNLFVRYFGTHEVQPSSYSGNELTVVNAGTDDMVNSIVVGHTYLVNSSMVNSFHFTYNTDGVTKFQVPIVNPTDVGVQGMYTSAAPFVHFSNINITGDFQSAGGFATPGLVNTKTWQLADDYNWTKGSHQLQFGASFIRPSQTSTFCVYCNGLFTFSGGATGDPMADFIAGALGSMTQLNISHDDENWRYLGLYAQDSWKISSRLTLNYGLRWEPFLGGTFPLGQVSHFSMADFVANVHSTKYPNAPAGTLYPGDPGFQTGDRPSYTQWNNWAPRIGLAWDPTGGGKTLIRASWGILYDTPETLFFYNYAGEPLWGEGITIIPPTGAAACGSPAPAGTCDTFVNPWAYYQTGVSPFPVTQNATTPYPFYSSYESAPLHVHNTSMEQWNLTIQRQIGAAWLLKASYLGNDLVHLWTIQEQNPGVYITPDATGSCTVNVYNNAMGVVQPKTYTPCDSSTNTNQRRLLSQSNPAQGQFYGGYPGLNDGGTGSYNALLLSAEHRFSDHFQVLANYTYSHCISDTWTQAINAPEYIDPTNRRFDRGNCASVDIHHNFNLSAVLQSPHFSSKVLQWIAGDWQLSPIVSAHTGSYFTVTLGGVNADDAANGIAGQRPNLVPGVSPYCTPKHVSPYFTPAGNCWINAAAFSYPGGGAVKLSNNQYQEPGAFGNEGVNNLEGPGYFDVDFALSRRFPITERQSLEIRWETFNVENRVNFVNPGTAGIAAVGTSNTVLGSGPTFGMISSDVAPRIMQFAIKYLF